MKKLLLNIIHIWLLILITNNVVQADFEKVKTKTFDGEKFIFPQDIKGRPLSLLFLAMSDEQENGTLQQNQLIEWHKVLTEKNILNGQISAYHFPVMKSPPFFVKGIIRSAMADAYEKTTSPNQSGVLFIKNLEKFAATANLTLDEKPTLVLLDSNQKVLGEIKGPASESTIKALQDLITANQ